MSAPAFVVKGTRLPGYVPTVQADGSVQWAARTPASGGYLAAYNGQTNDFGSAFSFAGYGIGFAYSDSGARNFGRLPGGKILNRGAGWESGLVKDPSIALIGRRLFMAYMGQSGSVSKIGLAIWNDGIPTPTPNVRQLLLDTAGARAWESGSCCFPYLYYDEATGILHVWYSAQSTAGTTASSIGHATIDPLTLTVTKDAGNPVIAPSNPDGEYGLTMGPVYKSQDGTFHLFCGAFNAGGVPDRSSSLRYTAPVITGPWTRRGVVYAPRPNAIQALAADAAAAATTVQVANSAVFTAGDAVYVQDNLQGTNPTSSIIAQPDNWEPNYVAALTDATHIKLREPLLNSYTVARAAEIVAVDQVKSQPRSCLKIDDYYVLIATVWNAGNQTYHEDAIALKTPDLATMPYALDRARGILLPKTGSTGRTRNAWDKTSSENVHAIPYMGIHRALDQARRASAFRVVKTSAFALGLTFGDTNWHALNATGPPNGGMDLQMPACSGDVIRLNPLFEWDNQAIFAYLDVVTVIYPGDNATLVNWISGGTGINTDQGVLAWRSPGSVYVPLGAPFLYTVKDNDLHGGLLQMRPMVRFSAASSRATALPASFVYENLGGGIV